MDFKEVALTLQITENRNIRETYNKSVKQDNLY